MHRRTRVSQEAEGTEEYMSNIVFVVLSMGKNGHVKVTRPWTEHNSLNNCIRF